MNDFKKISDQDILNKYPEFKIDRRSQYVKNDITYIELELSKKCDSYCPPSDKFLERLDVYDNIKISYPLYNEVLAYYVFLTKYSHIKRPDLLSEDDYPHSLFFNVGIVNVKELHKEIVSKGYYQKASNEVILNSLKVNEIKGIASKLGLIVKGKKEELINQILSNSKDQELSNVLGDEILEISQTGKKWIEDNESLYNYYVSEKEFKSFEEYLEYYKTHNLHDDEKNECLENIENDKEEFGRYEYDNLISLLYDEEDYKGITLCYLKELLIDMSGAYNYSDWEKFDFDKDIVLDIGEPIIFTPFLIKEFPRFKEYYDPSMIEEVFKLDLPINACNKVDFQDIAEMMFDGTMDEDTRKIYQNKLNKELKNIANKFAK